MQRELAHEFRERETCCRDGLRELPHQLFFFTKRPRVCLSSEVSESESERKSERKSEIENENERKRGVVFAYNQFAYNQCVTEHMM